MLAVAYTCVAVAILHELREKNFTFIVELSGWAVVTPLCFED